MKSDSETSNSLSIWKFLLCLVRYCLCVKTSVIVCLYLCSDLCLTQEWEAYRQRCKQHPVYNIRTGITGTVTCLICNMKMDSDVSIHVFFSAIEMFDIQGAHTIIIKVVLLLEHICTHVAVVNVMYITHDYLIPSCYSRMY